jgi:hypothetical protein
MPVDELALYAYSDSSQQWEREIWRKFLALLLPVLLEADSEEVAELFEGASAYDLEKLVAEFCDPGHSPSLVHRMSAEIAQSLGLPAEFGLAAFVEAHLPTRIHALRKNAVRITEQSLMSRWLGRFTQLQTDDEFLEKAAHWKQELQEALHGERPVLDSEENEDRMALEKALREDDVLESHLKKEASLAAAGTDLSETQVSVGLQKTPQNNGKRPHKWKRRRTA